MNGVCLGSTNRTAIRQLVYNGSAFPIRRKRVVGAIITGAQPEAVPFTTQAEPLVEDGTRTTVDQAFAIPVVEINALDPAFQGHNNHLGIACEDIPVGEFGYITVFGVTEVIYIGIISAIPGTVISSALGGAVGSADAVSNFNPIGLLLESATTASDQSKWAFVNFLGNGIPGGAAYVQSTKYLNKTVT